MKDQGEWVVEPFDLDDLVVRVRQKLEGSEPARPVRAKKTDPKQSSPGSPSGNGGDCPDPIELILYVSTDSPRSASALEDIQKVLTRYKFSRVKLTIHDLSKDSTEDRTDGMAPAPALVTKSTGPRTLILGHITNPELLLELLESCEEN